MPRRRRIPSEEERDDSDDSGEFSDDVRHHPQRNAANARERARMRVLSKAFCRLKTTLPWVPADTKLSKLDTLRLATSYIAHLRAVLTDQPTAGFHVGHKHPLTLTWPFSFQKSDPTQPEPTSNDAVAERGAHPHPLHQHNRDAYVHTASASPTVAQQQQHCGAIATGWNTTAAVIRSAENTFDGNYYY